MRVPALALAILTAALPVRAAEFQRELLSDGRIAVHMHGAIIPGDEIRLSKVLARNPAPTLFLLDSPGGEVFTALAIGRRNELPTEVRSGEMCASACAFIWVSSKDRYIETGAQVGFHAAYQTKDKNHPETGFGNAEVGAYYARLGFSDAAIYRMTFAPPESMHWISDADIPFGIVFAPRLPTSGKPEEAPAIVADQNNESSPGQWKPRSSEAVLRDWFGVPPEIAFHVLDPEKVIPPVRTVDPISSENRSFKSSMVDRMLKGEPVPAGANDADLTSPEVPRRAEVKPPPTPPRPVQIPTAVFHAKPAPKPPEAPLAVVETTAAPDKEQPQRCVTRFSSDPPSKPCEAD